MTSCRLLGIAALGLSVVACGKIRELTNKAKRAAETSVSAALGAPKTAESAPDARLQALVDQTPEGALFRKDLAFPEQLRVKVERRLTFEGARMVVKSAIGNQATVVSGTQFCTASYERAGARLALTIENAGFAKPEVAAIAKPATAKDDKAVADKAKADKAMADKAKAAKSKIEQAKQNQETAAAAAAAAVPDELTAIKELTGCKLVFVRQGSAWKPEHSNDFKLTVWGGNLAPRLDATCLDAGVMPRAYWFGKRRLKPGDSVPLSGTALSLLLGEGASGALVLKLESFAVSAGHPCGVFAVTGNYHAAAVPGPDGALVDQEVSITSGTVWLSLVYPLVIREQLETVQTLVTGARGGPSTRIQGKVSVAVTREWLQTGAATN